MLFDIITTANTLAFFSDFADCNILGDLQGILDEVFGWVQLAVPVLVIALCSVDCANAVISQDEKAMDGTTTRIIKRVVIGMALFFAPMLLNILLKLAGIVSGTCGIGG